jgi:hypothetical protein
VSLRFSKQAADAAEKQTKLQQDVAVAASQPYVWADVQGDRKQGTLINLVVGNSGPTVATNVRVRIDPPLPFGSMPDQFKTVVERRLVPGLSSLAPNRVLRWALGSGPELLGEDGDQVHDVIVDADGPNGPVPTLSYRINLADFRETMDQPDGTLHAIRKSIDELTKKLPKS